MAKQLICGTTTHLRIYRTCTTVCIHTVFIQGDIIDEISGTVLQYSTGRLVVFFIHTCLWIFTCAMEYGF